MTPYILRRLLQAVPVLIGHMVNDGLREALDPRVGRVAVE